MAIVTYRIDPGHSLMEFAGTHVLVTTIKGRFDDFEGVIRYDEDDPTRSSVELTIRTANLSSGFDRRDERLKSDMFLDVERFPTITFKSRRVETRGADRYAIVGDLTVRDVTREVELDARLNGMRKDNHGRDVAGFSAHTSVDRRDFGMSDDRRLEDGGLLVGHRIDLNLEVFAVKEA